MTIAFTTEARALALATSTENQTIGKRREPCGEREETSKRTQAWGFKSTMKKAPSKRRPATRKKVGCQGSALDDLSLTVTNRRKLGGD